MSSDDDQRPYGARHQPDGSIAGGLDRRRESRDVEKAPEAPPEAPPSAPIEPPKPGKLGKIDRFPSKLSKKQKKALKDAHRPLDSWERYRALTDVLDEAIDLVDLADHKARFALVIMAALNVVLFFVAVRTDLVKEIPASSSPSSACTSSATRWSPCISSCRPSSRCVRASRSRKSRP
jgi:hypothetical protein